eukprot:Skav208296  [mRNA]  locus=scaffold897:173665:175187:+ [translate_table: standard]
MFLLHRHHHSAMYPIAFHASFRLTFATGACQDIQGVALYRAPTAYLAVLAASPATVLGGEIVIKENVWLVMGTGGMVLAAELVLGTAEAV